MKNSYSNHLVFHLKNPGFYILQFLYGWGPSIFGQMGITYAIFASILSWPIISLYSFLYERNYLS